MKSTSKVKCLLAGMAVMLAGAIVAVAPTAQVSAGTYCPNGTYVDGDLTACEEIGDQGTRGNDLMTTLNVIINVAIGVIGFVAVVMIIVGGLQYTTSAGDAAKVTKAKNTIMYGVIGLVVALLAFAIVNFILTNVFNANN